MDPVTPHLGHGERAARRQRLDRLVAESPMRMGRAIREMGRQVFTDGAISKKHKELTALALAVATNCWE